MATTLRLFGALTAVALVAGGCGDDDDETASTGTFEIGSPASVVAAPTSAFPTVPTIAPITVDTADIPLPVGTGDIPLDPSGTGDIPVVPGTADGPVLVEATVGVDTGPDRVDVVPLGSVVTLSITNPDGPDEFHLHGYDLGDGQEFEAGETATFTFTADLAGDFELESHDTEDVLLVLRVQ